MEIIDEASIRQLSMLVLRRFPYEVDLACRIPPNRVLLPVTSAGMQYQKRLPGCHTCIHSRGDSTLGRVTEQLLSGATWNSLASFDGMPFRLGLKAPPLRFGAHRYLPDSSFFCYSYHYRAVGYSKGAQVIDIARQCGYPTSV